MGRRDGIEKKSKKCMITEPKSSQVKVTITPMTPGTRLCIPMRIRTQNHHKLKQRRKTRRGQASIVEPGSGFKLSSFEGG